MNKEKFHTSGSSINVKKWWSRRSKLEKKLLITLVAIISLFLAIVVYNMLKSKPRSETCTTPACLRAASQIITHIDREVDPCDDFFKFACGKFIEHIHGDIKATSIMAIEEQVRRQLTEIIKEPINDDDHNFVKIQKEMFQGCMNESAIEEETLPVFKRILEELEGWPVVVGYTWKVSRFDWKDMAIRLRQRGLPHAMILSAFVSPDSINSKNNILKISPPFVKNVKEEHKELYKKFMADVAVMFGAERTLAEIEMEKVLDFMDNLKKIADKNDWDWENETRSEGKKRYINETRFTIGNFQSRNEDYNDEIDWLSYLSAIVEPAEISNDTYVVFPRSEYLDEFFKLIHKTRKRIQANYMIWKILESSIPYLSKEIKERKSNYTCITEGAGVKKDRFKSCDIEISNLFYPHATDVLYIRRYMPEKKKAKVEELFDSIKSEFVSTLAETSWMDDESKEKALEKAEALGKLIGGPDNYLNDTIFEAFEDARAVELIELNENTTYYEKFLAYAKLELDSFYLQLNGTDHFPQVELAYRSFTKVNAMYSLEANKIILPAAILQGIFYNEERPMYLNYGAIGSIIGHEITHGFCEEGSKYDKDGNESEMWTETTKNGYEEATRCLIEDAENFDVEDTEATMNGTLTLEENVADFTGIKIAYEAYQRWVRENGEEASLPGIEYTPNQLFWISGTAYECYKLNSDKLEEVLQRDSHAHNSFRSVAPLRNNPYFAEDFGCPVGSNMNPPEKCQVF